MKLPTMSEEHAEKLSESDDVDYLRRRGPSFESTPSHAGMDDDMVEKEKCMEDED